MPKPPVDEASPEPLYPPRLDGPPRPVREALIRLEDLVAQVDALVADVGTWSCDHLPDGFLGSAPERTHDGRLAPRRAYMSGVPSDGTLAHGAWPANHPSVACPGTQSLPHPGGGRFLGARSLVRLSTGSSVPRRVQVKRICFPRKHSEKRRAHPLRVMGPSPPASTRPGSTSPPDTSSGPLTITSVMFADGPSWPDDSVTGPPRVRNGTSRSGSIRRSAGSPGRGCWWLAELSRPR
jgi:hypothetical protein